MSKKKKHDKGNFRHDFLQNPGPFGKPVSKHSFRQQLKSMQHLEFGPQMRELKSEKRISNLQQQRIGDWFDQYQQQLGRLSGATNQAYNQQIAGAQANARQAEAQAAAMQQQVGAQAQQSAALRGANTNPALDQQAIQAAVARRSSADSGVGLLRSQAASQNAYYKDKKRIGTGEEISQLLAEAARGRQVNQDIKDLNKQKQDFADKFYHDLRGQEQDFYLGLLQAQLGNKQAKLSAATSRANAKLSAHQSNINSKRSAATSRANSKRTQRGENKRFNKTHTKSGKSKGTVGSGSSSSNDSVRKAIADLRYHGSTLKPKERKNFSRQDAMDFLIHEGYSHKKAHQAIKRLLGGGHKKKHHGNPFNHIKPGTTGRAGTH